MESLSFSITVRSIVISQIYESREKVIFAHKSSMKKAVGFIYRLPVLMPVRADPGMTLT